MYFHHVIAGEIIMLSDEPLPKSCALFFVLLNPFLLSIYLLDLITDLKTEVFARVLVRGALISSIVFCLFSWGGEAIFPTTCKWNSPPFKYSAGWFSC
jgi:small neutral amino acid transporter SnatA (MarC family)